MRELNPKQLAFVREYLIDLNATQAAIRAGYSEKTAAQIADKLLRKAEIAAKVQEQMDKRAKRTELSGDYVLMGIKRVIERCEQAEPVMIRNSHGEWVESGEYVFKANEALRGYELLGKHLKLFSEKHEVTGKDGGPIQTEATVKLTPDQAYLAMLGKTVR